MGPLDIANHLLNFVAPAAAMALVLVLSGRLVGSRSASATVSYTHLTLPTKRIV